jgi:glycosyltransferase involved in cell wall biosynthesis
MKSKPLATVVIPAYNAEAFVHRTLASALNQSYTSLEVILVDDGSTDATRQIAKAVARTDNRLRTISVPNGGVANARNIGIQEARGELVAFLDADDLWHPTKIERQVAALTEGTDHQDAAAVYAFSRKIDVEDRLSEDMNAVALQGYAFARHLFAKPVGNGSSMVVRKEAARAVGGYDPAWVAQGIGGCEDLDFELKIVSRHPVAVVPQYLIGYRMYEGNMSSNKLPMARGAVATIEKHIRLHPEIPRWAADQARGAVLQYSLGNLAAAKRWLLFAEDLARLFRADPLRGAEYVARFPLRRYSRARGKERTDLAGLRPLFYDLDPSFGVEEAMANFHRRDSRLLKRLEGVDAALKKRILAGEER